MKEKYEKPEIEVIEFDTEDIMSASGTGTGTGNGNGNGGVVLPDDIW